MSHEVTIEVWSDHVCPFCYLEEPVLEDLRHQEGEEVKRAVERVRASW